MFAVSNKLKLLYLLNKILAYFEINLNIHYALGDDSPHGGILLLLCPYVCMYVCMYVRMSEFG